MATKGAHCYSGHGLGLVKGLAYKSRHSNIEDKSLIHVYVQHEERSSGRKGIGKRGRACTSKKRIILIILIKREMTKDGSMKDVGQLPKRVNKR